MNKKQLSLFSTAYLRLHSFGCINDVHLRGRSEPALRPLTSFQSVKITLIRITVQLNYIDPFP